jgi:diguanylate cyclase (GGDEF)-like protein/PAS domain S-box-containing protein
MGNNIKISAPVGYLLSTIIFVVALTLRLTMASEQSGLPFITFYPAMVLAYLLFGIGAGVYVSFLSIAVADFLFIHIDGSSINSREGIYAIFSFLISSVLFGWLIWRFNKTNVTLGLSEQLHKSLLDDQTDLICRYSSDGTFIYVNSAFCDYFGKSSKSLVGEKWAPVAFSEDIPMINDKLSKLTPNNPVVIIENRVINGKGEIRWGQFINRAFYDNDGNLVEVQAVGRDVTESKIIENKLNESNQLLSLFIENSPVALAMFDHDMKYLAVSHRWLMDYALGDQNIIGKSHYEVFPEIPESWKQLHQRCLKGEVLRADEDSFEQKNRTINWLQWEMWPWHKVDGTIGGLVLVTENIDQRKIAEEKLHKAHERFRFILENSPIAVRIVSKATGKVIYANPNYANLISRTLDQAIGINPQQFYLNQHEFHEIAEKLSNRETVINKLVKLGSNGETKWALASFLPTEFENEPVYLGWLYDITDRKQLEEQAEHLAYYDALTGLPNRRMLIDRLHRSLAVNKRSGKFGAVMFIDLDKFKMLNDTHGHAFGDLLLVEVAHRLNSCVRESDSVARIGGDEFVVKLSELNADENESKIEASIVADKIRSILAEVYILKTQKNGDQITIEHRISSSIGVALFSGQEENLDEILKRADVAMYRAKERGRNLVCFFDPSLN